MKVLVPVKRVVDYNVKVRAKSDETGPDLSNAKMAINPFCEIAIEEAVRLKEAGMAEEVIAVSVGTTASQEQLRTCLALGADRAILVETEEEAEPLGVAKALKAIVEKEQPGLIVLGKQAIDGDNNQTGQMLGALLNYPRYASLPNIMKAKKKPLDIFSAAELNVDIAPRLKTLKVSPPPERAAGIIVESVDELVDKLKNEAKVIS